MNTKFTKHLKGWQSINRFAVGYICAAMLWLGLAWLGWNTHMQPLYLQRSSSYPSHAVGRTTEHWLSRHHS